VRVSLAAIVFGYLLLVSAAAGLVLLPAVRERVSAWSRRQALGWSQRVQQAGSSAGNAVGAAMLRPPHRALAALRAWGRREWLRAAALILALIAPPLIALYCGQGRWLGGYDDTVTANRVDPQILALLQGEQLVPPPPLPPEVFTTVEAEAAHPMIGSASREWGALDADFRQRLLLVYKLMRERYGYEMVLIEGYRSPERQEQLLARGPQVTRAGAYRSYHQFGLAADSAFYRGGQLVISERDPWAMRGYQLYGEVAESVGLHWGGRWSGLPDLGHVELQRTGVLHAAAEHSD
jgi:peptidoglycan L-alanyl-D-glutamate endopeptidase CwlK